MTVDRSGHEAAVLTMLGDPKAVDRELRAFQRDAELLSSKRQHLIEHYANQWVAIYRGDVVAQAKTLEPLVARLKQSRVPRGRAIVRYISDKSCKMIL